MRSCLILPTYNEAENLERMLSAIRALAPGVDVLVVDDHSPDGTGSIADALALGRGDTAVLHRTGARGYGGAVSLGLRTALARGFHAVLTMDCDFSHDPASIPMLLDALRESDVAIGSRYVEGGQLCAWPYHRRLLSRSANAFVRLLFALPARDCTSGFRAYRREAIESIPWEDLHSGGYACLVELLYWASRGGARVTETPIRFEDRKAGSSKMGPREIFGGALGLLQLRALLRSRRRGEGARSTPGLIDSGRTAASSERKDPPTPR